MSGRNPTHTRARPRAAHRAVPSKDLVRIVVADSQAIDRGGLVRTTDGRARFSERELQVAALIADGLPNKEIATALVISEPTVKKHVGHILEKLGLADRLQAGLYIARNPLVLKR